MGEPSAIERAEANKRNTMLELIDKNSGAITNSLPRHIGPERMMRLARTAVQTTPALWDCHPQSVLGSLVEASQLGLEPNGPLGDSYLVPFFNKRTRRKEAQLIVAYRGYIELADRTGQVDFVEAEVVHEGDHFVYQQGMEPKLEYTRALGKKNRGDRLAVYAMVRYKTGAVKFVVLDVDEIEEIRQCSNAKDGDAWKKWWGEMAKKTALRRLFKHVRLSPQLARATYLDESTEGGVRPGEADRFHGDQQADSLRQRLEDAANAAEDDAIDTTAEVVDEDGVVHEAPPEPPQEAPPEPPAGPPPWEPAATNAKGEPSKFAEKLATLRNDMLDAGEAAGMEREKLQASWQQRVMKVLGEEGATSMVELNQSQKAAVTKALASAVTGFKEALA